MITTFNEFKNVYAETMMNYQCIEHDIKLIYAYMLKGSVFKHLDDIDDKTLGTMIRILEKLDYSDDKPYISRSDYDFLKKICDKRNYWAHQAFIDFIYIENPFYSNEYRNICGSLEEDCKEVKRASDILQDMRIEFCKNHKR